MNKKKRYIVILVVLAIYVVIMLLVLGKDMLITSKDTTTLIIGDTSIWDYKEESWTNITNSTTIESLSWKDYKVYIDNKEFGNYYLWNDDSKWYIFDEKKKAIKKDGSLIAVRSNKEIKIKDFKVSDIRNYYNVEKVLKQNELSVSSKYTVSTETSLDIDSDGKNEIFYFISNAFPLDYAPSKIFSIVFMVKDGKIYPIYTDISLNKINNGCKPYLNTVLDLDDDNIYEMVISCGKYSTEKPADMLYKFTDEGFKILISNQ